MITTPGYSRNINDHCVLLFFILLISADLVFIVLHCIYALTPFLHYRYLALGEDGGWSEVYQYIKWLWIIILLVYISKSTRSVGYIAWGLVFLYFLLDDSFEIHERAGRSIAGYLSLTLPFKAPFALRFQDLGELAVSVAAGVILLSVVALAYWYGSQDFKKMSRNMLYLVIALAFFGVVVDTAHIGLVNYFGLGATVYFILGVMEDGGEMLVASLMLGYTFLLSTRGESTAI